MDGEGRESRPGHGPRGATATSPADHDDGAAGNGTGDGSVSGADDPQPEETSDAASAGERTEDPVDDTVATTAQSGPPGLDAPTTVTTAAGAGLDAPTTHVAAADPAPAASATSASGPLPTTHGSGRRGPHGRPPTGRGGSARRPATGPLPTPGGEPMPGTMVVDRYRLVADVGQDTVAGAALWQARDVTLERDVAIALLTGGWQADARASSTLARATRNASFEHAHAARILDVVRPAGGARLPQGVLGAVVAEWTPGRDLVALLADGPLRPSVGLRLAEQLSSAVAEAHRSGLVLGMEHPQRVRITAQASARLAFPLARGDAAVADDVRGLGALMYLMLTGTWPDTGGPAPAGLPSSPRRPSGEPVPARQVRPDLPVELGALVDRTLGGTGGIRTAAAVHRLVGQMREGVEDSGVLLPVLEDGQALEGEPGAVWHTDDEPEETPDPARRRKLRIAVSLLVLATLAIVGFVVLQLISLFGGGGSSAPPVVIPAEPPAASAPPAPGPAGPPPAAPPPQAAVALSTVAVYAPSGDPDNPTRVNRAVDNDPATTWATSEYRSQFPALKPGVGMMTTFTAPATVSSVVVRSPSPGTRIEVRSASAPDVPLSQTRVLGSGTVEGPELRIPLQSAPPTSNLLIWVVKLGGGDDRGGGDDEDDDGGSGRYVSELAEVTLLR